MEAPPGPAKSSGEAHSGGATGGGLETESAPPVILFREVRKVRRSPDHSFELCVPEFQVLPGEVVVIVGSSGCGKSTLLDMLGLILRPDGKPESFTYRFAGRSEPIAARRLSESARAELRREHFGYVLQSGGLLRFLSARRNALLSCQLNQLGGRDRTVAELAAQFDLEKGELQRKPGKLSGGQRQRTAIVRALAHRPTIILADEPTASVDEILAEKVIAELCSAARERGSSVVLVTHEPDLIHGKADRVYTFEVEKVTPPRGLKHATRSTLREAPAHPALISCSAPSENLDAGNGATPSDDSASPGPVLESDDTLSVEAPPGFAQEESAALAASALPAPAPRLPPCDPTPRIPPPPPARRTPSRAAQAEPPARSPLLMVRLALADLGHEWLMNLCLALSLIAVIAPVLLGLGLKEGMVKTLLDRLRKDPRYYEIKSSGGASVAPEILTHLSQHPAVEALVRRPGAIYGSVQVDAVLRGHDAGAPREASGGGLGSYDLESSEGRDPLLLKTGLAAPLVDAPPSGVTGAALTKAAAVRLASSSGLPLQAGDHLKIRIARRLAGRDEAAEWKLRIEAILDPRAGEPPFLFVPLALAEDVEAYKNGSPVEARGWRGGTRPPAAPVCDGAFVILRRAGAGESRDLDFLGDIIGLPGWGAPRRLTPAEFSTETGLRLTALRPEPGGDLLCLFPAKGRVGVGPADFAELREFLRQRGFPFLDAEAKKIPAPEAAPSPDAPAPPVEKSRCAILPWVAFQDADLQGPGARQVQLAGLSADRETIRLFGLDPIPGWEMWPRWLGSDAGTALPPPPDLRILLPEGLDGGDAWTLRVFGGGETPLLVPVKPAGSSRQPGRAYVAAELAGLLRAADGAALLRDEASGQFFRRRTRYAGYRVYTQRIEQVAGLQQELLARGEDVRARTAEIANVLEQDRRLSALFFVVAAIATLGAITVLIFSLFASVERKRADFSILRLVGAGRLRLLLFPVVQALVVGAVAYLVAWLGVAGAASRWINRVIGPEFQFARDEVLCWVPWPQAVAGLALLLLISIVVALAAGWRAMQADPAAALRQE